MKLSYHKYYIEKDGKRYRQNLLPFIEKFVKIDSKAFKNSFFSHGDQLFLFDLGFQMFLFIVTKDNEIIKSVNSENFSHQDIHEKLSRNENIGFASYIHFSDNYYGIASTFYGPKNLVFNNFINSIFKKIGLGSYRFESMALPVEATRDTVLKLEYKGAVRFDVTRENPFFDEAVKFFGEPKDTNKICIEFKPEPKQEMTETFDNIVNKIEDDGLKNFVVKGKETLQDSLTDFYLSTQGSVSDVIKVKGELEICNSIRDKIGKNTLLAKSIREFNDDEDYLQESIQSIADFNNLEPWYNYLPNSPYAGERN